MGALLARGGRRKLLRPAGADHARERAAAVGAHRHAAVRCALGRGDRPRRAGLVHCHARAARLRVRQPLARQQCPGRRDHARHRPHAHAVPLLPADVRRARRHDRVDPRRGRAAAGKRRPARQLRRVPSVGLRVVAGHLFRRRRPVGVRTPVAGGCAVRRGARCRVAVRRERQRQGRLAGRVRVGRLDRNRHATAGQRARERRQHRGAVRARERHLAGRPDAVGGGHAQLRDLPARAGAHMGLPAGEQRCRGRVLPVRVLEPALAARRRRRLRELGVGTRHERHVPDDQRPLPVEHAHRARRQRRLSQQRRATRGAGDGVR